jgi:hypothetical protein
MTKAKRTLCATPVHALSLYKDRLLYINSRVYAQKLTYTQDLRPCFHMHPPDADARRASLKLADRKLVHLLDGRAPCHRHVLHQLHRFADDTIGGDDRVRLIQDPLENPVHQSYKTKSAVFALCELGNHRLLAGTRSGKVFSVDAREKRPSVSPPPHKA